MNIPEHHNVIQKELHRQMPELFIREPELPLAIEGVSSPVLAALLQELLQTHRKNLWVVFPTNEQLRDVRTDLKILGAQSIHLEPSGKELYAYLTDRLSVHQQQLQVLQQILKRDQKQIILSSVRAFSSPVMPVRILRTQEFPITAGQLLDTESFAKLFSLADYERVPRTTIPGEFSVRGEVIDIFPFEHELPLRIFLDWDSVSRIMTFDPLTQDTLDTLGSTVLYPITREDSETAHISEYFEEDDIIFFVGDSGIDASYASLKKEANAQFAALYTPESPLIRPSELLFDTPSCMHQRIRTLTLLDIQGQREDALHFDMNGPRSFFGNFNYFLEETAALKEAGQDITICAGSSLQQQRLQQMMHDDSIPVIEKSYSSGFSLPASRLVVICEHEIFGRRKKIQKAHIRYKSSPLDSFVDLKPGDYVVHINYGVGKFSKIDRIKAAGKERDYIDIEYSGADHIFIPIEQANLVQRYIGSEGRPPKLDTIGGRSWEGKKARARKSAEDLANMLIDVYAKRKQSQGYPFSKDTDWQLQFEAAFPFEETEDQLTCIAEVKQDMESPEVMDRLICGDVGFGKTEVAIRAAFKAVMSGKQVAFLAPTTILAEQHYETLCSRTKAFPMRIEMLSRFVDAKTQKATVEDFNSNKVDILVGTHRILQKDLKFDNLGLMIVDEEQRFGVKDKERIKRIRHAVDSLALSATPIPRTLYMSLLKIRDMSLLTTAPFQRRPVVTRIEEFDEQVIAEAIRHEAARGGQVFFLHNRVRTLSEIRMMLSRIVPEISVDFAHGKMKAEDIEDRMHRFIHGAFQVLVSTTIIENGIDIPNVNTIIIDRADIYGISQLYQLRGRVGRSNKEAYALLLYPNAHALSEIAMKRLKIISEHTDLGSGFKIAMKDMEIRGAGNLLGREQHGQMSAVGLDMYLRILDEAIAELSDKPSNTEKEVFLDLDYSGYIPDSYITDPSIKFDIYKKIASIGRQEDLMVLEAELNDRFGPMPEDMTNLLYIAELKILCRKLSIFTLRERKGIVHAEFAKVADISIEKVMKLISESGGNVTVDQKKPNILLLKTDSVSLKDKSLFILERLQRL